MKEKIDWEKVFKESDETMKKADAVSEQIKQERKDPSKNLDSKTIMQRVENDLKKNHIDAIKIVDDKRGD